MQSIFDDEARNQILSRLSRLTPDSQRRWGSMSLERAMAHLGDQIRIALGEIEQGPPRGLARFAPIRFLALHVLPWPKGRIRGPREVFTTDPESFEKDAEKLRELIHRLAKTDPATLASTHPLMGAMTTHD